MRRLRGKPEVPRTAIPRETGSGEELVAQIVKLGGSDLLICRRAYSVDIRVPCCGKARIGNSRLRVGDGRELRLGYPVPE